MELTVAALFVPEIVIGEPERNRNALENTIRACYKSNLNIDVAVGPELSICEYQLSEKPEQEDIERVRKSAEKIPEGETSQLLMKLSWEFETYLVAGIPEIDENGVYYNSAILTGPDGEYIGTYRQGREAWRFHSWATGYASEEQRNIYEIKSKKHGIVICAEITDRRIMSPTSELSEIILVPTSWYKEGNIFEDQVEEVIERHQKPLVISNRGIGFYDGINFRTYRESLAGQYKEGEPVKGRATIVSPREAMVVKDSNIIRKLEI